MNKDEKFWQKGIDSRRLYLYLKGHLLTLLGLCALGALLAVSIYRPVRAFLTREAGYEGISQYYITFEPDEFGDVYDFYNAYTWNHDVITCDAITGQVMERLPGAVTREQLKESVTAQLPGDVRFMTVTVTTSDEALTGAIQEAYTQVLPLYAKETPGLGEITLTQQSPVQPVQMEDKTANVALLGALLGLLGTLFTLLLRFGMDDAFYVEGDVEKQFPYPFLGQITREKTAARLRELWTNFTYKSGGSGSFCLVGCDAPAVREALRALQEMAGAREDFAVRDTAGAREDFAVRDTAGARDDFAVRDTAGAQAHDGETPKSGEPASLSFEIVGSGVTEELTEKEYSRLRQADGILLVLAYGKDDGRAASHLVRQLKLQDCKVTGILLAGAKESFLKKYYGRKGGETV